MTNSSAHDFEWRSEYPFMVYFVDGLDGEPPYYYAYCPDFGHSACSADGDTIADALDSLRSVLEDVTCYFREKGNNLPVPSDFPWR